MRHTAHANRTGFLFAALCWLAAGPGAGPLRALAECRHEEHAHHQHGAPTPSGPCFCGEMHADQDLTLPPAAAGHDLPAPPALALVVEGAYVWASTPLHGVVHSPESPPPESLA